MAERRMFAKSIVLSDAFLDMPMSARCLYFTLSMFADDDGFVGSPKAIMRQCGASNDDLDVLLAKRFILGFDTGVIVIKHWRMNNYIRNDRHNSTTYLEELSTLDVDNKNAYIEKKDDFGIPSDNHLSTTWLSLGRQVVDKWYTEDSIGKDSIVYKENIKRKTDEVVNYFNSCCTSYHKVSTLSNDRRKKVEKLITNYGVDKIKECFDKAEKSDFLTGMSDTKWNATFDWIINPTNFVKILDGNYSGKEEHQPDEFELWSIAQLNKEEV